MATRKEPRRTAARGSIQASRSLEKRGRELGAEGGSELLPERVIEGPLARADGAVGMTLPTDERYKMLRIDCGGVLPCSVEDFKSGEAHRELHDLLRLRFAEQRRRGWKDLEGE